MFVKQIGFVADDDNASVFGCVVLDLFHPVFELFEGL
jgi:hypothetical protein